jgi:hypothetical protein
MPFALFRPILRRLKRREIDASSANGGWDAALVAV